MELIWYIIIFLIVLGFLVYKEWNHKTRQRNLEKNVVDIEKIRKFSEEHVDMTSHIASS